MRSLWTGQAAVDAGRACRVLLFGLFLFVSVNHSASSPDVQPLEGKRGRTGRHLGLGCSGTGTHRSGKDGMAWDGMGGEGRREHGTGGDRMELDEMLSCWLADSWSLALW